jgi:hypothetical protein
MKAPQTSRESLYSRFLDDEFGFDCRNRASALPQAGLARYRAICDRYRAAILGSAKYLYNGFFFLTTDTLRYIALFQVRGGATRAMDSVTPCNLSGGFNEAAF